MAKYPPGTQQYYEQNNISPPAPNPAAARATWITIVCITYAVPAIGLFVLWLLNKRSTITLEQKRELTGWKKWVVFFFKELFLELISVAYFFYTAYLLTLDFWSPLNMNTIAICFYVIYPLKYLIVAFNICAEEIEAVEHFVMRVANTGWVPANWPQLLESAFFIPCLMLDGIFLNCDWIAQSDVADFFPYDGVVLLTIDIFLFLKRELVNTLQTYNWNYRYKVLSIFYASCDLIYTLYLVFLFIVCYLIGLSEFATTSIAGQRNTIIVLVISLTHSIFSRWTSMCVQGIKTISSNKRLREAPQIRILALNFYIKWFWFHPLMLILNVAVYGCTWFMYISVYTCTALFFQEGKQNLRPEWFIQGCMIATFINVNVFTVFYMVNLAYATLKRLGVFMARCFGCPCSYPLDCTSYAKPMNRALAECGANFRMNTHMVCE